MITKNNVYGDTQRIGNYVFEYVPENGTIIGLNQWTVLADLTYNLLGFMPINSLAYHHWDMAITQARVKSV